MMACKTRFSILAQALIFGTLLALALHGSAERDITKSTKNIDVKHPDVFVPNEPLPTVLIPGMGRFLLPPKTKCKEPLKPLFPYNPVTGEPLTGGSIGGQIPVGGGQGMGGRTQIPGGDDTFVPNPGHEVSTPGAGAGAGVGVGVPPLPHP